MKNFALKEFLISGTAKRMGVDMTPSAAVEKNIIALVDNILDPLREELGCPIIITSGYRPIAVNRALGSKDTSQHVYGEAADIVVPGLHPLKVCDTIIRMKLPFDQLIQEFGEWTHVSYGPLNRRQAMTASTDARGKTVYTHGI